MCASHLQDKGFCTARGGGGDAVSTPEHSTQAEREPKATSASKTEGLKESEEKDKGIEGPEENDKAKHAMPSQFVLHRDFYAMRVTKAREAQRQQRIRQALQSNTLPSVPSTTPKKS